MSLILYAGDKPDARTMGGKAAALAELSTAGLPIPTWFVVTPDAYGRELAEVAAAIEEAANRLFEPEIALAVRSSAVDEDGSGHSFAGQLESFLFVPRDRLAERVADVRRSGFSERVAAYRKEHGLTGEPIAPAVLIQQMIAADASGVAFAVDPVSGSRSTVVVSAVFGLGTALVGGDADADTYRLDRTGTLIEQKLAHKSMRHVADPSSSQGVREEPLAADLTDRPVLDRAMLRQIVELVMRVSQLRGRPQDIEWAVQDGKLYLLQSRPITSLANLADPDGVRVIWDNSNIAESYNGITTPLTFTFARRAYDGVYREFCRLMKVPRRVIADNDAMFGQMLGIIRGRIYYNLLNWYRLLAMLPGFSVNQKFMEQMMGVREGLPPDVADTLARRTWTQRNLDRLRLGWSALGLTFHHFIITRSIRNFYKRLNRVLAPPAPPLAEMRVDELTAEFRRLERELISRWDAPLVNDFLAMIFFGVLGKLCGKWCGDGGANLQNDLISDEGGMISTEPAKRINEMAALASADVELVNALCDGDATTAEARLHQSPALAGLYRAYLDKFGDRCLEELKLESATLTDDPTPLLRSIGHAARRQSSRDGTTSTPFRPRQSAEKHVYGALQEHRFRRIVFNWVLRNTRARVRDRENLRFERTRLFGRVRRVFVEVGRRLMGENLIAHERDVFYLTLGEILAFVEGTSVSPQLRELAEMRMKAFEQFRRDPAPADRFETRGAVYLGNRYEPAARPAAAPVESTKQLDGIGCCPGIVRGPVRVIRDPRGAHLRHGEILVAERTDPGWIMLFPAAAAVLVERGSLLSHSAIVAREMGIPAIVSIPNLTQMLTDGQWVEMNGATGVVKLIEAPAS